MNRKGLCIAFYDRIQILLGVCNWFIYFGIIQKKFLYYFYPRRNSLGNQKSSYYLMKPDLFTLQTNRLDLSSPKIASLNYGFPSFVSKLY